MKKIENLISPLVKSQFPAFYEEEGPRFMDFVKQYYAWMESSNETLNASRNLFNLRDIDETSEDFIHHFKEKYLGGVPMAASANVRFMTKHAGDFYKAKGTTLGVKLLIQGLFKEEAEVYIPGDDMLRPSDGKWIVPVYLEMTASSRSKSFVGKEIVGNVSGATAFMESLVRRRIGSKVVDVAYLSNLVGNFSTGEFVTPINDTVLEGAPEIVGSLTDLTIISGGADFAVGDLFTVTSSNGKQGQARVTAVSNETGRVKFEYVDALTSGGFGYSVAHSNVIVSEKVLTITGQGNANVEANAFMRFETVKQHLANLAYSTARPNNANFSVGDVIENYNNSGSVGANATVVALGQTNATSGYLIVAPNYGNVAVTDTVFSIKSTGTTATFNANTGVNGTTDFITTTSPHGFTDGNIVVYKLLTGNTVISGLSVGAAYYIVNANTTAFQLSDTSGGAAVDINGTAISETGHKFTRSQGSGVITSYADRSAYGNVVGANTGFLGVADVNSNGFVKSAYVKVIGLETNTYAYVSNVSTGTGATFKVGLLTDTESVLLSPDFLTSNNTHDVKFAANSTVAINLNGNNGGGLYGSPVTLSTGDTQYGGFGFIKLPGCNMDSILLDALRFDSTTIGAIATMVSQNPGVDYNQDPFVVVLDNWVAGYNNRDYLMEISGTTKPFTVGEQILQSYTKPAKTLTVDSFTGLAANGDVMSSVVVGELVYQSNSTVNAIAKGFVVEAGISAGSGTIKLRDVTGTFVNTTTACNIIRTVTSNATCNATFVDSTTIATTARGYVKAGSNNTVLKLKRINLENTFLTGSTVLGRSSAAVATVVDVTEDPTTYPIGLNANITANVQVANNVATDIVVTDSGFGYIDRETVTMTKEGSVYEITAITGVSKQGRGQGFYTNTRGFLDNSKKIQDSYYYQSYSYEIQTKVPLSKYVTVLKDVMHVAGTKYFGKVMSVSRANVEMTAINSIEIQ